MNRVGILGAVGLWFLTVASGAAPAPTNPREKLHTAIPEAIRLLEAKQYTTFLKNFVAPDDLQKITKDVSLDEFAKRFAEDKAPLLLEVLKSIQDVKPTLDNSGKKATYPIDEKRVGKKTITWIKVDKYWYIQN